MKFKTNDIINLTGGVVMTRKYRSRRRKRRGKFKFNFKINKQKIELITILIVIILFAISSSLSSCIKTKYNSSSKNMFSEMRLNRHLNKSYPVKINEVSYNWKASLDYKDFVPVQIVLHHTATTTATPQLVHAAHIANGWSGIGYHFLIKKDGTIYRGRPENAVGAHVLNYNSKSFGICLEGNFENEKITAAQEKAVTSLCGMLMDKYNISKIYKHGDLYNTACPGKNFPFKRICSEAAEKANEYKKLPD